MRVAAGSLAEDSAAEARSRGRALPGGACAPGVACAPALGAGGDLRGPPSLSRGVHRSVCPCVQRARPARRGRAAGLSLPPRTQEPPLQVKARPGDRRGGWAALATCCGRRDSARPPQPRGPVPASRPRTTPPQLRNAPGGGGLPAAASRARV